MSEVRIISEEGIDFLKALEGEVKVNGKHRLYDDHNGKAILTGGNPVGFPTIGHGHLLTQSENSSGYLFIYDKRISWLKGITDEEAEELLDYELDRFETTVVNSVKIPLEQHEIDALIVFAFNVGRSAFKNSTLLKVLNKGMYDEVPNQLNRWVYTNGHKSAGLASRRLRTGRLFSEGQYA